MPVAIIDGLKVNYQVQGSGPHLLMLAPGGFNSTIKTPALILPGADASHSTSSAWAMKELMPNAEFWNVLPPQQNTDNVLAAILDFVERHP
jgi:hypothetical protein